MRKLALALALMLAAPQGAWAAQGFLCCFTAPTAPSLPTPPTIGGGGNTASFTQGGTATVVNSALTLSGTVTGMTITISNNFVQGDVLTFTPSGGVNGTYSNLGVLSLSGNAAASVYQAVARTVQFSTSIADPTQSGTRSPRMISFVAQNQGAGSSAANSNVTVIALPTISGTATGNNYTQGGGAVTVAPNLVLSDFSSTSINSATAQITSTFQSGDQLVFTNQAGISGSYNAGTGLLNLTGPQTVNAYQQAMASIGYNFTGADVTNGGSNLSRTVVWQVTDGNGNASAAGSATTLFTVGVGSTIKPSWVPSWAAQSCNYTVNQCWNGTVVVLSPGFDSVTRSTQETCQTATTVTYAAANIGCVNSNGLAVWEGRTNLIAGASDISNPTYWNPYTTGSGTVVISGPSNGGVVVGPDGSTNATKVTFQRTSVVSFGDNAIVTNHSAGLTAGGIYSDSIWMKADTAGDVGKVITLQFWDGTTSLQNTSRNITLTANWANYQYTATLQTCLTTSFNCQFNFGFSGAASNSQTGTVNVDVWGPQWELGNFATPFIPTTTGPASRSTDNIVPTGTFSSSMAGNVGTLEVQSFGVNQVPSTLVDSNGLQFFGITGNQTLVSGLPTSNGPGTSATWLNANISDITWDTTRRTMALNHQVYYKDSGAPQPAAPFHFGALNGATQVINGYIQLASVGNSRVSDTTVGVPPGGTVYYFSAAGNNNNNCLTTTTTCLATKISSMSVHPSDVFNFNKGDVFGNTCIQFNGNGGNTQGASGSPITIQSYGTGNHPAITNSTTQCPSEDTSSPALTTSAVVEFNGVSGVIWNGVDVYCDTVGNVPAGIKLTNYSSQVMSNVIIENVNSTSGCQSPTGNYNTQGAAISYDFWGPAPRSTAYGGGIQQVTLLNITCSQSTNTSQAGAQACIQSQGNQGNQINFASIQGILAYNLGGQVYTPAAPNSGAIGLGLLIWGQVNLLGISPMQYIVVHDTSVNIGGCGGPSSMWTMDSYNYTIQFSEFYNEQAAAVNGTCDHAGLDIDRGNNGVIVQYNWVHFTAGPSFETVIGPPDQGLTWGAPNPVTFRYNIGEGSNQNTYTTSGGGYGNSFSNGWYNNTSTPSLEYIYNNTLNMSNSPTGVSTPVFFASCPGVTGSLFANNLMVAPQYQGSALMIYNLLTCPSLQFLNNGYYCPNCGGTGATPTGPYFWRVVNNTVRGSAAWQSLITGGDINGVFAVNPTITTGNQACYTGTTAPTSGPQPCPTGYSPAAAYKAPAGLDLTQSAYGSLVVGGFDYYQNVIPCVSGSGYPIGASC